MQSDKTISKSELSRARKRLVELMQRVEFGSIENLVIQRGEPVFGSQTKLRREIKLGAENNSRPELQNADFLLRKSLVDLFLQFSELQSGTIQVLEVRHGLPFRLIIEEPVTGANV